MSRYFLARTDGQDGPDEGPVEFRELVVRVRHGDVVADQRVREEHGHWVYAGEVIGLFAMAGRSDALEIWAAARRDKAESERENDLAADLRDLESADGDLADGDLPEDDSVEGRWRRRLREVTEQRAEAAASGEPEEDLAGSDELAIRRIQELKEQAILESVAESDGRAEAGRPGWVSRLGARLFSDRAVRVCFRWGVAAAFAAVFALGIHWWSSTESVRFPKKGGEAGAVWIFPGLGSCARDEYLFLLADAAILAGLAGFFVARWAEQLTSD